MKSCIHVLLAFALTMITPLPGLAQTPSGTGQQDERIVVGTTEVMLDAVVKDKKGRPVKDLTASDFEIYEDGVRQQIESFRLVKHAPGITNDAIRKEAAAPAPVNPARGARKDDNLAGIGVVALVFDRLSADARARARQAALSYLGREITAGDFVGVFSIDLSLRVLQSFTSNQQLVKQAIENAASHSPSAYASNAGQVRGISERQAELENSASAAQATISGAGPGNSSAAGAAGTALGANMAEQKFNEMTTRMLETFETLERDQQGYATTDGLLAVVNSLRGLSGRKAIIFFSEGIAIPPAVQAHFRSVISNANRANVSIYAVDAAGLRVESANTETRREIAALGARRMRQVATGREDTSGQPLSRLLERNEDLLRLNPHSGLGQLADETGGFLISETNNPGAKLRQVDEDLHTYYALTYIPKNRNYDGRFRQITVKLDHPGLDVQTRKGYYAINASYASPVLAYEAPALALLGSGRRPDSFPMEASAFYFPEPNRSRRVPVLVEVPPGAITYSADNEKKIYHTDFVIIVLIKDGSQQVVRKLSNQYLLNGPLDKLPAAKRGEVLFYREADLAPGHYTFEAAVYDAADGRASVRKGDIEVPGEDETKLRLSSVVLIDRAERLTAEEQKKPNPFHFGEVLVYPNMGEPLHKSVIKQLAFFFTAYPSQSAKSAPKATIEVMQGGRSLGRASIDLPKPDATGRIQYASALPIDKLPPGSYQLKITASDGEGNVARSEHFTIAP